MMTTVDNGKTVFVWNYRTAVPAIQKLASDLISKNDTCQTIQELVKVTVIDSFSVIKMPLKTTILNLQVLNINNLLSGNSQTVLLSIYI